MAVVGSSFLSHLSLALIVAAVEQCPSRLVRERDIGVLCAVG